MHVCQTNIACFDHLGLRDRRDSSICSTLHVYSFIRVTDMSELV